MNIESLIRKIEAEEESRQRATQGEKVGVPGGPSVRPLGGELRVSRRTEYRTKSGDISSVLAFDDVTGMKLGAGKVIEARGKEIQ